MKDTPAIVAAWQAAIAAGEDAVLATITAVEGSSYRRPGARMLVRADGSHIGSVSGGCLESHVAQRAWWLTQGRTAMPCRYDTGQDEDAQWAFGLGCEGVIHVLLERLDTARGREHMAALESAITTLRPGLSAVVTSAGGAHATLGSRYILRPDGSLWHDMPEALARLLDVALQEQGLENLAGRRRDYTLPDGSHAEVFFEHLTPPQRLMIFGAGHDALPLAQLATQLGWHVTVADGRSHYARRERFPHAHAVMVTDPEQPLAGCPLGPDCAVVVMTHSQDQDRALLRHLLPQPLRYLGQLGPRKRTERLLDEIEADAPGIRHLAQTGLHYPIGLDIGADTPEDIALAILAEIKTVLSGRDARPLQQRQGTIHDTPTASARIEA